MLQGVLFLFARTILVILMTQQVLSTILNVVFKGLELLERVNVVLVKFELGHCEGCFHLVLFSLVVLDNFLNDFSFLVEFRLDLELLSLIHFLILLVLYDLLNIFIDFCLSNVGEQVLYGLGVVVHNEELTFVFLISSLENYTDVTPNALEFLKAYQCHVESDVRTLLVNLVGI